MRRDLSNRLIQGVVILVLVTLNTGLPSHHHNDDSDRNDVAEIAPAHHEHGVIITEQAVRLPSLGVGFVIPIQDAVSLPDLPVVVASKVRATDYIPPHERPPPSASPRAPPVSS
jgi:hypothetical protein